jgi:hypothetical protein
MGLFSTSVGMGLSMFLTVQLLRWLRDMKQRVILVI